MCRRKKRSCEIFWIQDINCRCVVVSDEPQGEKILIDVEITRNIDRKSFKNRKSKAEKRCGA